MTQVNPYISGPPVTGANFYGRRQEIKNVLETSHKLTLFVATRRMGKTSLLRQLWFKCSSEEDHQSNLCIGWDLQGLRNAREVTDRFVRLSRKQLPQVPTLSKGVSAYDLMDQVCQACQREAGKERIVLLIDEPEVLYRLATSDQDGDRQFLIDLKLAFEQLEGLRVVMVAPPRINRLHEVPDVPDLLDNFQTFYMTGLDARDASDLIQLKYREPAVELSFLTNGDMDLVGDVVDCSNRVPFYVQLICSGIFDRYPGTRPGHVIDEIIRHQRFAPFFVSDFRELHPVQKLMLLHLVHSPEPLTTEALVEEARRHGEVIDNRVPAPADVDNMVELGTLRAFGPEEYHFANRLFEVWILRDFDNRWRETQEEIGLKGVYGRPRQVVGALKRKDLEKVTARLKALDRALRELSTDARDGALPEEFYVKRKISLYQDNHLVLGQLKDHLRAVGAMPLVETLEAVEDGADAAAIGKRLALAQESEWGPVVDAARKEFGNDIQRAVLMASCRAAEQSLREPTG